MLLLLMVVVALLSFITNIEVMHILRQKQDGSCDPSGTYSPLIEEPGYFRFKCSLDENRYEYHYEVKNEIEDNSLMLVHTDQERAWFMIGAASVILLVGTILNDSRCHIIFGVLGYKSCESSSGSTSRRTRIC